MKLLRFLIGLAIIALLIWKMGVTRIYETTHNLELAHLPLLIFLLLGVLPLVRAYSYLVLLRITAPRVSLKTAFIVNAYSWALGLFMPGGKLGEFSAIYFFKKEGISVEEGTAAVLTDKIISFIALSILASGGLARFLGGKALEGMLLWLATMCLAAGLVAYLALRTPLQHQLNKLLGHFHISLATFLALLTTYAKRGKIQLLINLLLTVLGAGISAAIYTIAFNAFGQEISFVNVLLISSAGSLAALLPISIGGLGVRETSAILLFNRLGINSAVVLSSHILVAILSYLIAASILLFYVTRSRKL